MADEIQTVLVLSTAHVSASTAGMLTMQTDDVPICFEKGEYGWWVLVPDGYFGEPGKATQNPPTCPPDLKQVLRHARALGCQWVCLDRDGDRNGQLPTWEW
jgi:hypothetical protein